MNTTRTRTRVASLAVAAAAGAYGITATAVDLTPRDEPERAATAIEYGLIAALHARGISFNGID